MVVLTIAVPQPLEGWDWGCAVQITGLGSIFARPRLVFGIDALDALQLAMQVATVTLETSGHDLEWLGQRDDLGLPKFLPNLPQPQLDRLERAIDREVTRYRAASGRQVRRAGV